MKFSFENKLKAVKSYLSGFSESQVTKLYGVNRTDLFIWVERYRQHGEYGLQRQPYFKATKELRLQIVSEHLIESVSLTELSAKYLIARSAISKWCKIAREQGYEYLAVFKTRGRPPKYEPSQATLWEVMVQCTMRSDIRTCLAQSVVFQEV